MLSIINVIVTVILIVLGTLLGDGYKNSLYLYWLISLIVYGTVIQFLISYLNNRKQALKDAEDKITTLTITKNGSLNNGVIQCSLFPRTRSNKIDINRVTTIDVIVTSAIPLSSVPEIKLITEEEWEVSWQHQKFAPKKYAGKFEYYIGQPITGNFDSKHFKYSFDIKFNRPNTYNFTLLFDNGEVKNEIINSLKIRS
ncbi:hypothetical protein MOF38_04855 [Bacillus haynesii]|uniref:hypothetical protein n=1 Tax=Bacillus haynesii TaxID=1925021 RepID=UPI0022816803|nr:hypothetical protein [Bacillus haynesii]MCY9399117.1 hypothetical protein [Bacillus haynesii]